MQPLALSSAVETLSLTLQLVLADQRFSRPLTSHLPHNPRQLQMTSSLLLPAVGPAWGVLLVSLPTSEIDLSSPLNFGTPSSRVGVTPGGSRGTPIRPRGDIGHSRRVREVNLNPTDPPVSQGLSFVGF